MPGTIAMGTEHPFVPERLVVAVLAGRSGLPAGARTALEERFGPVDHASDPVPWSFSAYYDREMGPGLVRMFWSFERLVDPADLASIKRATNDIEDAFRVGGDRTVNLDPGLLSLLRFALATTKDGSHRIPLRDGIYAEVTLVYESGGFHALPWTYPDYHDPGQQAVLEVLRERYREALRRQRG